MATPALALNCPDETGHSNINPANVTYYLTESACLKFDPGSGVKLTANIVDNAATVTFLRPGTTDPSLSTSFTTGSDCPAPTSPISGNVASYGFAPSKVCQTTVRLANGAEFAFTATNDVNGFTSSFTKVRLSVATTAVQLISSPNPTAFKQAANFTAVVTGGVGAATDVVSFKDGATTLGPASLTAAGGGLSVVSIASGTTSNHACAIMTDATVKCWGRNDRGQLGDNSLDDSSAPVDVQNLTGVVALALGTNHSCALTQAGGVKCWGGNGSGRLGDNNLADRLTPVDVVGLTSGVTAIAVGNGHGCALTVAGGVKCWGLNDNGQLGDGGRASAGLAAPVPSLTSGVIAIAAGGNRTCAITATDNKCWGDNSAGAIGDGTKGSDVLIPTASPFLDIGITAFALGTNHTCAQTTLGLVVCWGANDQGQLGDGTNFEALAPSVSVSGLGAGVASISAGFDHSCALLTTGALKCWGGNGSGQVGDGTGAQKKAPVDLASLGTGVKSIVAANGASYAVTSGLGAKSWGANFFGQLGDGLSTNRLAPADVLGLDAGRAAASLSSSALTAGNHAITATYIGDSNRTGSASASLTHAVAKAATTATLAAAPASPSVFGQAVTLTATVTSAAGTPGGTVSFSDSVNGALGSATLSAGGVATLSTSVLSGGAHTITATYSGATNFLGSAGTRAYTVNKAATTTTLTSSLNPSTFGQSVTFTARAVAVTGSAKPTGSITITDTTTSTAVGTVALSAVTQAKVQAGDGHACSLGSDGGVSCWGSNTDGQLGDGTTVTRLTPVTVSGLSTGVKAIATGNSHSCAVTTAGAVKCWGANSLGQLGNNTTNPSSVPVSVFGLSSGVVAVAVGNSHSCALTSAGSVKCWGDAGNGQLGNGGTDNKLVPVQVSGLTGGISAIASGGSTGCAIIASGGLLCWGANALGQVGDGSGVDQLSPIGVFGLEDSGVASVSVGNNNTCAVTTAGAALCWGGNFSGQLGDGTTFGRLQPTPVQGLESGVASLGIGSGHSCAVTTAGAVKCWGGNTFGQLGDGGTTDQKTAVAVSGLSSGISSVAGGSGFTCARTTTGTIRCWGGNSGGSLGDGTQTERHVPVTTLHPVTSVASVTSAGLTSGVHALRATYAGDANYLTSQSPVLNQTVNKAPNTITFPALGNASFGPSTQVPAATASSGLAISYSSTTTAVCTVTSAGIITHVSAGTCSITASQAGNANFVAAAPVSRSFAVFKAPTTMSFGIQSNPPDELGKSIVLRVSLNSAAGSPTGSVVFTDSVNGALGSATVSAIGNVALSVSTLSLGAHTITATYPGSANFLASTRTQNFTVIKATPTVLVTASPASPSLFGQPATFTVSVEGGIGAPTGQITLKDGAATLTTAALAAVGTRTVATAIAADNSNGAGVVNHACLVTAAGGLKCWGGNASGEVGDGTLVYRPVPVDVPSLRSGVKAVAPGRSHTCVLMVSGGVKCWGDNTNGQLGTGGGSSLTPVDVPGLTSGVTAIVSGSAHSCAITASGGLKCWGDNSNGQLGDGTFVQRNTPVDVTGLTSGVALVSASGVNTCAIVKATGGLKCWGYNVSGQLGNGNFQQSATPVAVTGLASAVASVSLGNGGSGSHACAVTTAGAAKCWGSNAGGKLGDGTQTSRSTPVQVVGLESGVASLALGAAHSCALTTSGAVKCWGGNFAGQVGDGTSGTNRLTPISVVGLGSGMKAMAASQFGSFALTTAGVVKSWGDGAVSNGSAIGSLSTANRLVPADVEGLLGGRSTATFTTPSLTVGAHSITAVYSGDAGRNAATSPALAYTVNKGATVTALTTSSANVAFGASVTLTATVGVVAPASATPSGVVTFLRAGNVAVGTAAVSAGKAILATTALPAGANSVTARYDVAGADPRLLTSTSAAVAVTVAKRASTTTLAAAKNPVPLGTAVTLTATIGTGATGNVTFKNGAATIATVALANGAAATSFTPSVAGTLSLTASYAGDGNFVASTSAALKLVAFASCKDGFASALPVSGANATVFGTTVGATGEAGEPNHAGNSGALNSVWCTWTAPAAGTVTIDTTGSAFDTTLGVYTGAAVNALTQVAANDNIGPGNTRSRVSFAAIAGTAYRIAIDGVSATGAYVLNVAQAPAAPVTFASVLPTARSIATGATATAFATMINTGATTATACSLALPPGFPASFSYQATDATNALVGTPDTPKDIAAGAAQGFFFAVTPLVDLNSSELAIVFDCTNTPTTITVPGLNTLLLSASSTPSPDLVSIGSTPNGDGIASIPGNTGSTAFGAATVNIGAAGTIIASVDDNGKGLALTALLCVTNPATGACVNPATPAATATFSLAAHASATVAVFVTGTGNVPFDPGANRLFLRFKTADGVTRGATSVAVRTQ